MLYPKRFLTTVRNDEASLLIVLIQRTTPKFVKRTRIGVNLAGASAVYGRLCSKVLVYHKAQDHQELKLRDFVLPQSKWGIHLGSSSCESWISNKIKKKKGFLEGDMLE